MSEKNEKLMEALQGGLLLGMMFAAHTSSALETKSDDERKIAAETAMENASLMLYTAIEDFIKDEYKAK